MKTVSIDRTIRMGYARRNRLPLVASDAPAYDRHGRFIVDRVFKILVADPEAWDDVGEFMLPMPKRGDKCGYLVFTHLTWNQIADYCRQHKLECREVDLAEPDEYKLARLVMLVIDRHGEVALQEIEKTCT